VPGQQRPVQEEWLAPADPQWAEPVGPAAKEVRLVPVATSEATAGPAEVRRAAQAEPVAKAEVRLAVPVEPSRQAVPVASVAKAARLVLVVPVAGGNARRGNLDRD